MTIPGTPRTVGAKTMGRSYNTDMRAVCSDNRVCTSQTTIHKMLRLESSGETIFNLLKHQCSKRHFLQSWFKVCLCLIHSPTPLICLEKRGAYRPQHSISGGYFLWQVAVPSIQQSLCPLSTPPHWEGTLAAWACFYLLREHQYET